MSVSVQYVNQLTVQETLTDDLLASGANSVQYNGLNVSQRYNSASTPPVTKVAAFSKALSSGAGTIDFTALTGTNGAAVTGLGLKVQFAKFRNPSTNTGAITIVEGATNGLALLGAAFKIVLPVGAECSFALNDASPDIASGDRTIDLTGTGTEELECIIVMG